MLYRKHMLGNEKKKKKHIKKVIGIIHVLNNKFMMII
jgi:hypothetical protein